MKKIKNLLLYGGVSKEQFSTINGDIARANRQSLLEYCTIAFGGMGILFILSYFVPVFASSRGSYLIFVILSCILYCTARWLGKKYAWVVRIGVYIFEVSLLAFGIILGTIVEPNQASASFAVLMFAVPLLFVDVPIVTGTELVFSIAVYIIAAKLTQSDAMFAFNISVVAPYGIVAIILCSIILRLKVTRIFYNYTNRLFGEHDQLTGLYNRRVFEIRLDEIKNGKKNKTIVIFEFDINGLKETNDTKGHVVGDELITSFANIMTEVLSPYGDCFRTGGDEFFAILTEGNPNIDDLIYTLNTKRKEHNASHDVPISFAVGAVKYSKGQNINDAMLEADRLMYESKQMHYFKRNNNSYRSIDWTAKKNCEDSFEDALKNKEFKVFCQPKYNAVSGVMTSAEALVRWIKDDGTVIPPGDFISIYEGSGQIVSLDKYMFESVCEMQKSLLDSGITPLPVSVNLSRISLFNLGIVEALDSIIQSYGLPKKLVPIEITESAAFDSSHFESLIKRLKNAGFYIHMDDFGQGYSSINNLRRLPLDVVKMDKSIIDDIGNDGCDETLRHVIELAHFLKMEIVAEGVESEAQVNFLRKISCDTIQGYYFSKPINLDEYKVKLGNLTK